MPDVNNILSEVYKNILKNVLTPTAVEARIFTWPLLDQALNGKHCFDTKMVFRFFEPNSK